MTARTKARFAIATLAAALLVLAGLWLYCLWALQAGTWALLTAIVCAIGLVCLAVSR